MFLKPKSEIRKHYFLNQYVVITPRRDKRPFDVHEETVLSKTNECVLCPENVEKDLIIEHLGGRKNWRVMVLKNKFPALTPNNKKALGQQEVIIETPVHGIEMAELSVEEILDVLRVYRSRVAALLKNKKLNYVLIFKNSGSKAGASLHHTHTQVFASHLLPPRVVSKLAQHADFQNEHDICPYCHVIKKERRSKRAIIDNEHLFVVAPYASKYHYEAWFMPKRHVGNITELNDEELEAVAVALKQLLGKLEARNISYNLSFDYVPNNPNQHMHIKLQPRDSVWAGVELNTGLIINSVPPEDAAKFYKAGKK